MGGETAPSSVGLERTPTGSHAGREVGLLAGTTRIAAGDTSWQLNRIGWFLFGLGLILVAGQFFKGVDPQDEGQFLTYPWLMSMGRVPYRDLWMSYPPAGYAILVPFFKLNLPGMAVERLVDAVAFLAYVLGINRMATGGWKRFSWVAMPAAFALLFISADIRLYPWNVGMPFLVLGLAWIDERPWAAAAVFFVASTLRFEFGIAGMVALVSIDALPRPFGKARRGAFRAGVVLAAAMVVFYVVLDAATAGSAIQQIFVDQLIPVEKARRLPLFPPVYGAPGYSILATTVLGPIALLMSGLVLKRADIAASNLAVAVLLPHYFQRADASHLFGTAAVVVPWTIVSILRLLRGEGDSEGSATRLRPASQAALVWIFVGCSMWASIILLAYAVYLSPLSPLSELSVSSLPSRLVSAGTHTVLVSDARQARDDRAVIRYLHRNGSDRQRVFIIPLSIRSEYDVTYLYYVLRFPPAARYLEVQGGIESQARVQREIMHQLTDCTWVVQLRGGKWYNPTPGDYRSPIPLDRYIRQHFRIVYTNYTYRILKARG